MIYTVPDILISAADCFPDKDAVYHGSRSYKYFQILQHSQSLAIFLKSQGINKGDRVCFYLEKRIEKVISIFGISLCGGIFVPIRKLSKEKQAFHIIKDSGACVLISTASRIKKILKEDIQDTDLKFIISVDDMDDHCLMNNMRVFFMTKILENSVNDFPGVNISENDISAILYTSGSTGNPKGVVLSHLNIVAGAKKVSDYLKINKDDILISLLTFGFDYGLNQLMTAFLHGAGIVLLDYLFPGDIFRTIEKFQITGMAAIPTIWLQLLRLSWPPKCMDSLRYITNSGGTIPKRYIMELRKRLPNAEIFLMYGLTEAFRSTYLDPSLVDICPDSIGKAIPGEEILVLDENDNPVQPGQTGKLVHRGVLVSQGYWNNPEATGKVFKNNPLQSGSVPVPEKVVYSGDYVRVDEQGLLYFSGRKDEMIKCSGNRISPEEIEEILYNHWDISEAVVFGIPDEIYGQAVYAIVSCKLSSNGISKDMLVKYCKQKMPNYMVPADIEIWDSLPKNTNGKLDRAGVKKAVYEQKGFTD